MPSRPPLLVVFPLILALLLTLALGAPLASAAPEREQLTPVIGNAISEPEPVLASNGRRELAYELQLINRSQSVVTVRSLEALAGGKVLQKLTGSALEAQMSPYGQPQHS